jgi:hypothetical protein
MSSMEKAGLAYRELKPGIGALLQAEKAALLGGSHARAIRELLEERGAGCAPRRQGDSDNADRPSWANRNSTPIELSATARDIGIVPSHQDATRNGTLSCGSRPSHPLGIM